jgi:hypothetical protein
MNREIFFVIILLVLFSPVVSADSLELVNTGLEQFIEETTPYMSAGYGDMMLVGINDQRLLIYDVANPLNPTVVDTIYNTTLSAWSEVIGSFLYSFNINETHVYDISQLPEFPFVGTIDRDFSAVQHHHSGEVFFIDRVSGYYEFYRLGDNPLELDSLTSFGVNDPTYASFLATPNFIVHHWTGGGYNAITQYRIIDVTNPFHPIRYPLFEMYAGDYWPGASYSHDNYYYTTSETGGSIWNLETLEHEGWIYGSARFAGDYYVDGLSYFDSSYIYRLADPANPTEIAGFDRGTDKLIPHPSNNNFVYRSNSNSSYEWMQVIDSSDLENPVVYPTMFINDELWYMKSQETRTVSVSDKGAFVLSEFTDTEVIETLMPDSIYASDVLINNDIMYVEQGIDRGSYSQGILIYDISIPGTPSLIDTLQIELYYSFADLEIDGRYLYTIAENAVLVYDISTPEPPQYIARLEQPLTPNYISVDGNYLYALSGTYGDPTSLRIYNIEDLSNIEIVDAHYSKYPATNRSDWYEADQGRIFTSLHEGGDNNGVFVVMDASDPANMVVAHEFIQADMQNDDFAFSLDGDKLFLATSNELTMYDVSDIYNPIVQVEVPGIETSVSCSADEGHVYLLGTRDLYHYVYEVDEVELHAEIIPYVIELPLEGGTISYDVLVSKDTPGEITADMWVTVTWPDGNPHESISTTITLTQGDNIIENLEYDVLEEDPSGIYVLTARIGTYPDSTIVSASFPFEKSLYSSVDEDTDMLPDHYKLSVAHPNPFNASTNFTYSLPAPAELKITVFNVLGQRVSVLADGSYTAGVHRFSFSAVAVTSGLYFIRATVPGQIDQVQKVMFVR